MDEDTVQGLKVLTHDGKWQTYPKAVAWRSADGPLVIVGKENFGIAAYPAGEWKRVVRMGEEGE